MVHKPVVPVLERLRQENYKFDVRMGYIRISRLS